MVSRDPEPLLIWRRRAERARLLAERYPASAQVLRFYAELAEWQGTVAEQATSLEALPALVPSLRELVARTGPPALGIAAVEIDARALESYRRDGSAAPDPFEFFARALLQAYTALNYSEGSCPWCAAAPLCSALRPQAEGLARDLVCALCFRHRPFPRGRCAGCGETDERKFALYSAPEFPHLRLEACETCRGYLPSVDLSVDPHAIPEVDELAGLPLDLWAAEQGYGKLTRNLAGI